MKNSSKTKAGVRPRKDLGIERVEDDFLILDKRNQKVHRLNATASIVWSGLQDGRGTDMILKEIIENFGVSPEVAEKDVAQLLDELSALNLVEVEPKQ